MRKNKKTGFQEISENEIKNQILQYLTARGIFAWRQNSGAFIYENNRQNHKRRFVRCGIPGISDIIGFYKSTTFFLEVKTPTGKPTKNQKLFLEQVNKNNQLGVIVRSLDDCIELFEQWDRKANLEYLRKRFSK